MDSNLRAHQESRPRRAFRVNKNCGDERRVFGSIKTTEVHLVVALWLRSGKITLSLTRTLQKKSRQCKGTSSWWKRVFLIPDHLRPIFNIVPIRHMKQVNMPSPRKAPPSRAVETDMPSRKKAVAAPSKSLGKTQGQKGAQVAQRRKSKSEG